ncbi:MAG: hypothetical protein ACEQSB_01855 [Undibacterium sp.]
MAQIKKSTLFLGVAILAGLFAAVKFLLPSKSESESSTKTTVTKTTPTPPVTDTAGATNEMNKQTKEVSVSTAYSNPSGKDEVKFSLFVDSTGMIVDAKVGVLATNDISKKRQMAFADGLPAVVKGKKLSELSTIDKVGGSSLTTKAFNDSLATLKSSL